MKDPFWTRTSGWISLRPSKLGFSSISNTCNMSHVVERDLITVPALFRFFLQKPTVDGKRCRRLVVASCCTTRLLPPPLCCRRFLTFPRNKSSCLRQLLSFFYYAILFVFKIPVGEVHPQFFDRFRPDISH